MSKIQDYNRMIEEIESEIEFVKMNESTFSSMTYKLDYLYHRLGEVSKLRVTYIRRYM